MWRYQLWQLGRNILSSAEALKKCHCSFLDLAFKPPDLKHKGAGGVGNNQTGSSSKRCVPLSHLPQKGDVHPSAHQQLGAVCQRERGVLVTC